MVRLEVRLGMLVLLANFLRYLQGIYKHFVRGPDVGDVTTPR